MRIKEKLHYFLDRLRGEVPTATLIKNGLQVGTGFHRMGECIIDPGHCWHIRIGNNVTLAPRVHILAHDASMHQALGYTRIANVNIGDVVFIGAGSIIMPGVTIGSNVIVGAGSCVTKDIPDDQVWAGNPARFLSTTQDFLEKHRQALEDENVPKYGEEYTLRRNVSDELRQKMFEETRAAKTGYVV